jgi:ABC-type glycerol-3-phosphate transport system substrate-binding protein
VLMKCRQLSLLVALVLAACGAAGAASGGGPPAGIPEARNADARPADWDMLDASTDPSAWKRIAEATPKWDPCDVNGCLTP